MADQAPRPDGDVLMTGRTGTGGPGSPLAGGLRWRRVFSGQERELSALRRWLSSLLPDCPARGDVLTVANELASNAVQHTLSGRGAWFAVEIIWHPTAVQVAVADCGGPAEPQVINDPDAERGRGLLMVRGLSFRTGYTGDQRGRLVWAQVPWAAPNPPVPAALRDPYQAAVRDGEAALARRFAGVPAWFGPLHPGLVGGRRPGRARVRADCPGTGRAAVPAAGHTASAARPGRREGPAPRQLPARPAARQGARYSTAAQAARQPRRRLGHDRAWSILRVSAVSGPQYSPG